MKRTERTHLQPEMPDLPEIPDNKGLPFYAL